MPPTKPMSRTCFVLAAALLAAPGCAESIGDNMDPPDGPPVLDGKVGTSRGADSNTTLVDASALEGWTYVDFTTGTESSEAEPWDLRFQRFHISTNGGVSGTGGVEVARVEAAAFAEVKSPPGSGFFADGPDGDDTDTLPDYAFDQDDSWYSYNINTHVLTPRPIVWIVRTGGGDLLKLELVDYYDQAGTSGFFTLRWAEL